MPTPAKIIESGLPVVALVGRVNVGKSTLFNRILERPQALVSDIPGTTRTRNVGVASWRGKNFEIIDTGGLSFDENVPLEKDIINQTTIALKSADVIIFVISIQEDILPQEKELARLLKSKYKDKPIIFVANKADNQSWENSQYEQDISKLNLGEPILVSAQNGKRLGDLLDLIYKKLNKTKKRPKAEKKEEFVKVTLMGKPNVGKSSLFNKLVGEDQVIVSDMPHTTREPYDTLVEYDNKKYLFVDTAGIRKKTKVSGKLEQVGIGKSISNIERSDIILFLLDAAEPITDQDKQLAGLLKEHSKSVIIIINKWDLAEGNEDSFRNEVKTLVYKSFPHLDYAPIVFISAKSGYRIHQIFPLLERAWLERQIEIPYKTLDGFLQRLVRRYLPTKGKGTNFPKILTLKQLANNPPIFEILIKSKTSLSQNYVNFLKNKIREQFSFYAAPIVIKIRKNKKI